MKPILFNTEMVQAILDGRKTVTRRVVKSKYDNTHFMFRTDKCGTEFVEMQNDVEGETFGTRPDGTKWRKLIGYIRPKAPYQIGDILYVRETWQRLYELDGNEQIIEGTEKYYYAATDTIPFDQYVDSQGITHDRVPWRPSLHMPKVAARLFLRVKDVRVEKLKDMRLKDCLDEGVSQTFLEKADLIKGPIRARERFECVWDSTIKKTGLDHYGWSANPWVWVIEFERCEKPEEDK